MVVTSIKGVTMGCDNGFVVYFPEISNVANMGSRSFRKNLPWALPYAERREALGGTSNKVNSVDLVNTRARLTLNLISTLAGIVERAD